MNAIWLKSSKNTVETGHFLQNQELGIESVQRGWVSWKSSILSFDCIIVSINLCHDKGRASR